MAALMFWSMKKSNDKVKPKPMEVRMPASESDSTCARSKFMSTTGGNFSTSQARIVFSFRFDTIVQLFS